MSQIFISHSKKDIKLSDFFAKVFASTKVEAKFEELEKIFQGKRNSHHIKKDIEDSSALFVILSGNVNYTKHTRDWITWETGVGVNKDIWVFEYYNDFGNIDVIIPVVKHYLLFSINTSWFRYLKKIIQSYNDSEIFSQVIEEIDDDLNILAGKKTPTLIEKSPLGKRIRCPKCNESYNVHIPRTIIYLRCPVCNARLKRKKG